MRYATAIGTIASTIAFLAGFIALPWVGLVDVHGYDLLAGFANVQWWTVLMWVLCVAVLACFLLQLFVDNTQLNFFAIILLIVGAFALAGYYSILSPAGASGTLAAELAQPAAGFWLTLAGIVGLLLSGIAIIATTPDYDEEFDE